MEINNLKIDEDLKDYLASKQDANSFVNECIREKMKSEGFIPTTENLVVDENDDKDSVNKGKIEPVENKQGNNVVLIIAAFIGLIILIVVVCLSLGNNNTKKNVTDLDTLETDSAIYNGENPGAQADEKKGWEYTTEKDEMRDSKNRYATLISDNYAMFDAPYDGGSSLSITVRYMKKYGTDVMLQINPGQFNGNEYEGTNYVTVRFDGGSPRRYTFNESDDGSPDVIFINKKSDFIARCKKAKSLKIEAPFYQEGNVVFNFKVNKTLKW
jgi:hypothetical protein